MFGNFIELWAVHWPTLKFIVLYFLEYCSRKSSSIHVMRLCSSTFQNCRREVINVGLESVHEIGVRITPKV